jgi:ethanolamine utilization protein EutQ (cupin superfamily)
MCEEEETNMARVTVIKPTFVDLRDMSVFNWPIGLVGVSRFHAHYDENETCYIDDGKISVTTGEQTVIFGAGDLATFPAGTDCTWRVISPVRMRYNAAVCAGQAA